MKIFSLILFCFIRIISTAQPVMLDTAQSQYLRVDDVKLHYKVWGKGEPLLLLHGAMEYWREWKNQIPALAKNYKVYAIDTRGHGESTFTDRQLSYDLFADDIYYFVRELGLDSVHIVGFGDGGIIGMKMAIRHPERMRKLVCIGANIRPDTAAIYPDVLQKVKGWDLEKMAFYLAVKFKENPNNFALKDMAKRMQKLLLTEPNIGHDELDKIKCPTLIMCGDHDLVKLSHTEFIFENLPNGFLCVIPGSTHYCIKEKPGVVNAAIHDFLQFPQPPIQRN